MPVLGFDAVPSRGELDAFLDEVDVQHDELPWLMRRGPGRGQGADKRWLRRRRLFGPLPL
jgi:hypothetical protein